MTIFNFIITGIDFKFRNLDSFLKYSIASFIKDIWLYLTDDLIYLLIVSNNSLHTNIVKLILFVCNKFDLDEFFCTLIKASRKIISSSLRGFLASLK